jgi:adenylate cyclase
VVKYIGDAIFAFWSAPEPQEDHAARACEAALRFQALAAEPIRGRHLRTRIGLHTGVANVGNFGSSERVDYTALGESVNLASRIEGLNKFLGTSCLMTDETHEAIGNQNVVRRVGRFRLKGFDKAVGVFELVGWSTEEESTRGWRTTFEEALTAYENKEFEQAGNRFRRTLDLRPEDGPSRFYLHHINRLGSTPLPPGWNGEVELTEK